MSDPIAPKGETAAKDLRRSTDRRVVRTRKAIREAFFKLMENQDYHKITIASVAREADIDRKTFYLHYRSVSDLVDEVIRDEAQKIVASCREALHSDGDKGLDVSKLFQSISLALAPDMTRSKRVLQHVSLQDVLDRLEASLVDVLMEDNVLGLRRDDPYVPYIVSFFCAGLVAVYRRWLITDSEIPLESLAGVTSACLFDGLNGVLPSVKPA
ncbi:TetR/AcrR family transcriptional regulator [Senegalimassilia anaerobia]